MSKSFMMRKEYGEDLTVLDLGYFTHLRVLEAAKTLRECIGKVNFQVDCDSFLKVNITKKKDKILQKFNNITKGGKHWNSDYHWNYNDNTPYGVENHPGNIK